MSQTREHVQILERVFQKFEIDPEQESPGREIVRDLGASLVAAMEKAEAAGNPAAAQLVACECVVLAETKDHADWELLSKCAQQLKGSQKAALEEACDVVEEEEDEHSTTARAGLASCGSTPLVSKPCCRLPKRRSTSRLRSVRRARSRKASRTADPVAICSCRRRPSYVDA